MVGVYDGGGRVEGGRQREGGRNAEDSAFMRTCSITCVGGGRKGRGLRLQGTAAGVGPVCAGEAEGRCRRADITRLPDWSPRLILPPSLPPPLPRPMPLPRSHRALHSLAFATRP